MIAVGLFSMALRFLMYGTIIPATLTYRHPIPVECRVNGP